MEGNAAVYVMGQVLSLPVSSKASEKHVQKRK